LALIAVIIIFLLVVAALIVAFVPVQAVNFSQANEASAGSVDSLKLFVNAEIANVNVMFRDLPANQRAATNVSATGWRGIFGTDNPLALVFSENTVGSTLEYSVNVSKAGGASIFNNLNVVCDVYVAPSVNLDIVVNTGTGSITMDADRNVTLTNLNLQATTGTVSTTLREGVTISGDFSLETTTGSAQLTWVNAKVSGRVPVSVKATTGSVDVNVTQAKQLGGNVTLNAETTTGGVTLTTNLQNDVAARISANSVIGGVSVNQQGFSGNSAPLQSNNYPAGSNFEVTLGATTGGISINANFEFSGTRS
jgi:hypothetical protein